MVTPSLLLQGNSGSLNHEFLGDAVLWEETQPKIRVQVQLGSNATDWIRRASISQANLGVN
jgi:hypothetical protein